MPFDRFLIAPFDNNSGLDTSVRPWQIPDNAFAQLQNVYIFRGRVRKRFGGTYMGSGPLSSQLRLMIGTTDSSGNLSATVLPGNQLNVGALFSVGANIYTVITVPVSVGNASTLSTHVPSTGTVRLDSTTPNVYKFTIGGSDATIISTPVYWYPANPVMGLANYQVGPINNQPSFAFDTQFAYTWVAGGWTWSNTMAIPIWNGDYLNFFDACNWVAEDASDQYMFVTNFQVTNMNGNSVATDDPIYLYTNSGGTPTWAAFYPYFNPATGAPATGPYVLSCRLIVVFHNRLILLNVIENNNTGSPTVNSWYPGRARFCYYGDPMAVNAWYEPGVTDNAGGIGAGGGFVDASTDEQIVSAEFIKDRLIVYFERSTWELAYTSNQMDPFAWYRLNTELGSEATFSSVVFDREILVIGTTGIHACNGSNVARIDNKIPDEIFEIRQLNNGIGQVVGIRDYYIEQVYWTFPSAQANQDFPDQVLVYNYKTGTWALNDDCITVFGYFEQQSDLTWASSAPLTWSNINATWTSGIVQAQFRQVLAGNQQGFVFIVQPDIARNAGVMNITNLSISAGIITLTVINHSIPNNEVEYILLENVQGTTGLNGNIYAALYIDANTISITSTTAIGSYTGGGTIARVSNIQILSKQWNPYDKQGRNVYIGKIDFLVQTTQGGQITVDYYPSSTELSMIAAGQGTGSIMGTGVLETSPYATVPLEAEQVRVWHPLYFQTDGECIQIYMYFTDAQITNPLISLVDFELDALTLYCNPTSSRLQG